jgi:hypothetical protein
MLPIVDPVKRRIDSLPALCTPVMVRYCCIVHASAQRSASEDPLDRLVGRASVKLLKDCLKRLCQALLRGDASTQQAGNSCLIMARGGHTSDGSLFGPATFEASPSARWSSGLWGKGRRSCSWSDTAHRPGPSCTVVRMLHDACRVHLRRLQPVQPAACSAAPGDVREPTKMRARKRRPRAHRGSPAPGER